MGRCSPSGIATDRRQINSRRAASLCWNFARSFHSGALHMMARKNSILAPFERVTPDQWHFFKHDYDEWHEPKMPDELSWHDPRYMAWWWQDRISSASATGPAGERLF